MNRREFLASSAAAGAGALVLSGCATGSTDPLVGTAGARASGAPSVYEMRVYHFNDGKGEALLNRFRHHTLRLFKKHGIESVGYWLPVDAKDQRLHFLLRYPSREAREASWKAFVADPEWQAAYKASEANGALVKKAETPFLVRTDYSPVHTSGNVSKGGVFELRTYTTPPGRLANLDARFRDHTLALFARHGMHNWLYFHKMPDQPEADVALGDNQHLLPRTSPSSTSSPTRPRTPPRRASPNSARIRNGRRPARRARRTPADRSPSPAA